MINGRGSVRDNSYFVHTWEGLANTDTGVPLGRGELSDKVVHVTGTFGAGGTVLIQGSMDGVNWVTLRDPHENALSFTSAGLKAILESPLFIRPSVSGDGTTAIKVVIGARSRA